MRQARQHPVRKDEIEIQINVHDCVSTVLNSSNSAAVWLNFSDFISERRVGLLNSVLDSG